MVKGTRVLMPDIFVTKIKTTNKINYNLYHFSNFSISSMNSVFSSVFFLDPRVWGLVPSETEVRESLEAF